MVWKQGVEGRLAKSLIVLYDQVEAAFPANRNRSSDGTIGDASHQAGTSDHNPGPDGVVTALDITNDPAHGLNSRKFVESLFGDERIKYVISNRQIASGTGQSHTAWEWRAYDGNNPHDMHCHISVKDPPTGDIETPWKFTAVPPPPDPTIHPILARGSTGDEVKNLQEFLLVDGVFGTATENAVKAFQRQHGISPDGIVGPYTWREILKLIGPAPPDAVGWQIGITCTVFGGSGETQHSAYDNHVITETELAVALPYRFSGARPKIEVKGPGGTAIGTIQDIGPWNINDPYWETGSRPQAESGTDKTGRKTNLAGIDLSPAMAKAVGIDGKGKVDWRIVP